MDGDSSKFDSTILFCLILNSNSVGENLRLHDQDVYSDVDQLRKLRNEVVHRTDIEVRDRDFRISFFAKVRGCCRRLGFPTEELDAVETAVLESENLRRELERERQRLREYDGYFTWRNSRFNDISRKCMGISPRELMREGILSEQDVVNIESQQDEERKNAMIVDCVLIKGQRNTSAFLSTLHQTDSGLAESFTNTLPHNTLTKLTIVSPVLMQKARYQYPENYKAIMLAFTKYIYRMDWDTVDKKGKIFLELSENWSVKLFVMIELAYGYNVRGDSERAIALLDEVTQNVNLAGPNSRRILSRAYSRKALHYIYVREI